MTMMAIFDTDLGAGGVVVLCLSLAIAFGFEFINGFHDTANAVATVIYTNSLRPWQAVIWSGICNFVGVLIGGVAVAFSIVHLLPVDLLVNLGQTAGLLMVLSLLVSACVWNLGTWYLGLPVSSSHTLVGSILGVGLASTLFTAGGLGSGVNWAKAGEVILSLLISPFIGFVAAALLLLLAKRLIRQPQLYQPPVGDAPPPLWIRSILVVTCTGVSLAHGSNDGQKGIGLIMLILIGMLPAMYALNMDATPAQVQVTVQAVDRLQAALVEQHPSLAAGQSAVVAGRTARPAAEWALARETAPALEPHPASLLARLEIVRGLLTARERGPAGGMDQLPREVRWMVRSEILQLRQALLAYAAAHADPLGPAPTRAFKAEVKTLVAITDYAPTWVPFGVALALGIGTMIGWKRIVITVGERIGKMHLTYGQGASAELVAMCTIGLADWFGLPVSTTQVLSSGVAGTMAANRSGLQARTVKHIAAAWVLTLPVCMLLSAGLFLATASSFIPRTAAAPPKPQPVALVQPP